MVKTLSRTITDDTNELPSDAPKPTTRKPGFRTQKEAKDAAVFELGEYARHGFEFETMKVDGRWIWRRNDEVPAPTDAEYKCMGGRKAFGVAVRTGKTRLDGAGKAKSKTGATGNGGSHSAKEQTLHEQRGAERAKAEGRLRPGTSLTALAQAITDGTPGKALDASDAPEASAAATAADNALGTIYGAGQPLVVEDPLAIPDFLMRPKPTAAETEAVRKKIAKVVGPERVIKNPPDAKKSAADPAAPKPARVLKAAKVKPPGPGVGAIARDAILRGKSNEDALAAVMKAHPSCSSNLGCMNWYRNKLKKDGLLLKTGEISAKGKAALSPTKAGS